MNQRRAKIRWLPVFGILLLAVLGMALLLWWDVRPQPKGPLAELPLADGRVFQVEALTHGTEHAVGRATPVYNRLSAWIPGRLAFALQPKRPRNTLYTSHPALVIWVNALDAVGRTNVDCQGVRVELRSDDGEWFGGSTPHWFGSSSFWRVGHVFHVYPRHETNLTLRITPWRTNAPAEAVIENPAPTTPRSWPGKPTPQDQIVREFTVRLTGLTLRTNNPQPRYYQTATPFWDPAWTILKGGAPAAGWQEPVWIAEDVTGNRGQWLGTRSPVLRYSFICYPSATNEQVAELITQLPPLNLATLNTNFVANQTFDSPVGKVRFVGAFPPSTLMAHVFAEGEYLPNPSSPMGGVTGGAPSGWTGMGGYANPFQEKWQHGHYSAWATFYLHADLSKTTARFGIRLRTEDGRLVPTRMEPSGSRTDIWPYLAVETTNLTMVTPEIVLLRPLEAQFDVDTATLPREPGSTPPETSKEEHPETAVDAFD